MANKNTLNKTHETFLSYFCQNVVLGLKKETRAMRIGLVLLLHPFNECNVQFSIKLCGHISRFPIKNIYVFCYIKRIFLFIVVILARVREIKG